MRHDHHTFPPPARRPTAWLGILWALLLMASGVAIALWLPWWGG